MPAISKLHTKPMKHTYAIIATRKSDQAVSIVTKDGDTFGFGLESHDVMHPFYPEDNLAQFDTEEEAENWVVDAPEEYDYEVFSAVVETTPKPEEKSEEPNDDETNVDEEPREPADAETQE